MDNKQVTLLKQRVSELEKSHNRLTAIVVHIYRSNQQLMKEISVRNRRGSEPNILQGNDFQGNVNESNNLSSDIDKLLICYKALL